ncbi:MAG: hypothetical protein M1834_009106 [Cirrosporium novae-zelandiae]|nr:MAG: hypothetical protein M1834_009106 [Cirrosporium novae-zelandiae]
MEAATLTAREALSGITGSISIACWIFLMVPQLIENYKNGSAEGLSLAFLFTWFVGDLTNLFGAFWAGLVPTVIAIAVYFCFADLILISQCIYYKIKNGRKDARLASAHTDSNDPHQPLLGPRHKSSNASLPGTRRRSSASTHRRPSHTSRRDSLTELLEEDSPQKLLIKNIASILLVCAAGAAGWAIAWKSGAWTPTPTDNDAGSSETPIGAEILGYISAVCYLGARIPQIIKNWREHSCEGLSLLFFILSLLGNATYGAGILFHSTEKDYFLTNLPWLIGSLGTMAEDVTIFAQFHIYRENTAKADTAAII